ncbi:MAG: hypothetical protein NVSMB9_30690 [Isosphaeraceae bacterium]
MVGRRIQGAALALLGLSVFSNETRAQNEVPGGWASQVAFQSFQSPGASVFDVERRSDFGMTFTGIPFQTPFIAGARFVESPPQVVNQLSGFSASILPRPRRRARR